MNGVINVLKPPGMTSSDVVVFLRRILRERKVGHTGTLDPAAAGVLPICIGKATKLSDYIMADRKTYRCGLTLGMETDTLDAEGRIVRTSSKIPEYNEIERVFYQFRGKMRQVPPMYSAIKVRGKKLYELAREGKEIEVKPREIEIYSSRIIRFTEPDKLFFEVECSKGTYIRSLCRDIGELLECGAYMSFLIRLRSGIFDLSNAITLDEIEKRVQSGDRTSFVMTMDSVLVNMNVIHFKESAYPYLLNGNKIEIKHSISDVKQFKEDELLKVYCKGTFMGLGTIIKEGNERFLRIKKLLI